MLSFRILGPLEVIADSGEVTLGGRKERAVLAFLLLGRGAEAVSRDHLIDGVWGESPPKTVGAELRVYVSKLRKRLPADVLVTRPEGYALRLEAAQLDAERFERTAREGSALLAAGNAEAAAPTLAAALAMWRGPVLADLAYEPWVESEARRLDEIRLVAIEDRIDADLALGRHADVVAELAQLVAEHGYRERLHAQLMTALYRSGRQADALATYRRFRTLLRHELGLEPGPELQRLERDVLNHDPRLEIPTRRAARATPLPVPRTDGGSEAPFSGEEAAPFVGREAPMQALFEHLRQAFDGLSQIAFIRGEAGSGKSTVLAEFARRAEAADLNLVVASGICRPTTGAVDLYAPFRQVLGMLAGDLGEALSTGRHAPQQGRRLWAASSDALGAVIEHGPELLGALVPARDVVGRARSSAPDLTRQVDQLAVTAARARDSPTLQVHIPETCVVVLDRISRARPLVVLLDDLQWADASTLEVLALLAEERTGGNLMVVGAFRPEEAAHEGPDNLPRLLHDIRRRRGDVVIDLDGAAAAEARSFVDALLDIEPNTISEELRRRVTERSGGNAMFAVELIRELKQSGMLRRDEDGRWTASTGIAWDRCPARIEGLLAGTFARVEDEALDALRVGSVEGEEFTADVIAAVLGTTVDEIVRRISGDVTERLRIVRAVGAQRLGGARVFRYRFRHNLYQRFLYDRLDEVRRPRLHERVASALEALGVSASGEFALSLAHHFESAAIPERAIPYLHRAGSSAVRLCANEQAADHLSRAIALVERLPVDDQRRRTEADLQLQLAIALSALRGFSASEVERAYARATELTMASLPTREQFPIQYGLWVFHASRGNFDQSRQIAERMMEYASKEGDESLRLQALHARWPDCIYRGCIADAIVSANEGLAIYRPEAHHELTFRYGNHDPGVCALGGLALAHAASGDAAAAVENADAAVELSDALGHSFSRAHARALRAWACQIVGNAEAAAMEADRALELESEVNAPYFFAIARAARGWALSSFGDTERAVAELESALTVQLQAAAYTYAAFTAGLIAEAHVRRQRREPARGAVQRMLTLSQPLGTYFCTPDLLRVHAEWLVLDGQAAAARTVLLNAIDVAREQGSRAAALRAALALAPTSSYSRPDMELLSGLRACLPADTTTDDAREATAILGRAAATTAS